MSILNLGDNEKPTSRARKPLRLIVGGAVLVAVVGLGQTLAAQITLNTGSSLEFGQGVAQTTACSGDNSILVTPTSTFENTSTPIVATPSEFNTGNDVAVLDSIAGITVGMFVNGAGYDTDVARVSNVYAPNYVAISEAREGSLTSAITFTNSGKFMLTSVTVSGIPDTCRDKIFRVKIYGETGADPLTIAKFNSASPDDFADIWWGSGFKPADAALEDPTMPADYAVIEFINGIWTGVSTDSYGGSSSNPKHPFILTKESPLQPLAESGAFTYILPLSVPAGDVYKITIESRDDGPLPSYYNDINHTYNSYYDYWKATLT